MNLKEFLEVIEETPYNGLLSNTVRGFKTPRKQSSSPVQVTDTIFIPDLGNGTLMVKAKTRSGSNTYNTEIQFLGVEYVNDAEAAQATIKGVDGDDYYFRQLRLSTTDVRVRCTCMDFYWRFSIWNHSDGSLLGNPPDPYVKKTDREPVNPQKLPGVCKHLIKVVDQLRSERFFI